MTELILDCSTLRGTKPSLFQAPRVALSFTRVSRSLEQAIPNHKIHPPKRYDDHPHHFYTGVPPPGAELVHFHTSLQIGTRLGHALGASIVECGQTIDKQETEIDGLQ